MQTSTRNLNHAHQPVHKCDPSRRGSAFSLSILLLALVLLSVASTPVRAADDIGSRQIDPPDGPVYYEYPGVEDPLIRDLWNEGAALEEAGEFIAANVRYQDLADRLKTTGYPYWRMSRNLLAQSMVVPQDDKDEQVRLLELADHTADLGIEIDGECAECLFWKYRALGRLPTVRGMLSAAADAKTMSKLLNRGIELGLAKRERGEERSNTTLANFYYASATFYRMVPDWFWLRWVFGVQGSKERALSDSREAVALTASRIDYQIELGASLLCLGGSEKQAELIAEGNRLLRRIQTETENEPDTESDTDKSESLDHRLAGILIESPENACEFSRNGFLDVNAVAASQK